MVNKQSGRGAFDKILIDLYDLKGMYWNELFPTLKLKGGNSFSFLTDYFKFAPEHIRTL